MLIVACISGHGFGHGARTAAVLSALAALEPGWRIVLSTPLPADVLAVAMGPVPFLHRPCRWDVGVVQADALGADEAATLAALEQLERDLPLRIEQEAAWIAAQGQPVLVLGDVPPAAALLAARLGAPLVWLASFGWEAIYAPMGGPFLAWAEHCRALYARGQLLLRCPLALPIAWGLPEQPLGLVSARPRLDAAQLRRQLALPPDPERCVLVSFGGMGFQLDPALLARWPEYVYIGTDPALAGPANGRHLPAGARPLDLMPLARRVITKPGFSTFCEAFSWGLGCMRCGGGGLRKHRCWRGICRPTATTACSAGSNCSAATGSSTSPCCPPAADPWRPMGRPWRPVSWPGKAGGCWGVISSANERSAAGLRFCSLNSLKSCRQQ
ncbi:MAG: hypothetical protein ACKOPN_03440 [Prochlorococcaceae cyanobacterium]